MSGAITRADEERVAHILASLMRNSSRQALTVTDADLAYLFGIAELWPLRTKERIVEILKDMGIGCIPSFRAWPNPSSYLLFRLPENAPNVHAPMFDRKGDIDIALRLYGEEDVWYSHGEILWTETD